MVKDKILNYYPWPGAFNDIAILKLSRPIDKFIIGKVEPACFNTKRRTYSNILMASGWGDTSLAVRDPTIRKIVKKGKLSEVLKMAFFKEVTTECKKYSICVNSENEIDSVCFIFNYQNI